MSVRDLWFRLRQWLLIKIAGGMPVMINVGAGSPSKDGWIVIEGDGGLVANCTIFGIETEFRGNSILVTHCIFDGRQEKQSASDCQYVDGGCLRDDGNGICPLCDDDVADPTAEGYREAARRE